MNHLQGLGISQDTYSNQDVGATTAATAASGTTRASQAAAASASLAAAFSGDQTRLSAAGSQISPADGSDVRVDKVAALQTQIAAGTYNVSSSDVAEKIIGALLK
jgi:negative regulator of flagellin synthesis FlgM